MALAKLYASQEEIWTEQTKTLAKIPVGAEVSVQNQTGNRPKRWDRTGTVVEILPHQQYKVRMDGSGDISLRNRRFLRKIMPIQTVIDSAPSTSSSSPSVPKVKPPQELRRSNRKRTQTKKF